jgi:short subunit dehydrogenase-like uncharacterized protein
MGVDFSHTDGSLLIYGASGYSAALIARAAVADGMRPILAGRSRRALEQLATELRLEFRVAELHDDVAMDRALEGVGVVLHGAGPFSSTATPMLEACLRAGAHYLDLTGEIAVVEYLASQSSRARSRGIMVMPGVGMEVVAGDCLALHVAKRIARPCRMAIGLQGLRLMSRGTAKTLSEGLGVGHVRRDGRIVDVPAGTLSREFDFGWGPMPCLNAGLAEVATAYYTTGIPTAEMYTEALPMLRVLTLANRMMGPLMATAPAQAWLKWHADMLPPGPDAEALSTACAIIVIEVEDARGHRAVSRQQTPGAYTFTAMVAPVIAARALAGDVEPGFQTPGRVYGADFPLSFDGVIREDLQ